MQNQKIVVLENKITISEIKELAKDTYEFMIKGTVDLLNKKVALGGQYHIDSCNVLTDLGGRHTDIWGFNIVFDENNPGYLLEYDSLVNIKPSKNNKSRIIDSEEIKNNVQLIVSEFILI